MATRSRKATANGTTNAADAQAPTNGAHTRNRSQSSEPPVTLGPLSVVVPDEERDVVKVNNASVSELKNACDDALKRVSREHHYLYWSGD